jgi:hypothetical protein
MDTSEFVKDGSQLIAAYLEKDARIDQWHKSCIVEVRNTAMCRSNPKGECWMETEYHTSWDWLMPAIKKARAYYVPFTTGHAKYKEIEDALTDIDIDRAFTACVKFVMWYRSQL